MIRIDWTTETNKVIALYEYRLMVMRHWRAGGKIQFRVTKSYSDWTSSNDPNWEPAWDWDHSEYKIVA